MTFQDRVIWAWLRQSRSQPPGEASKGQTRRAIFQSSMQQFDELMVAARATGLAARPLPLFYALSQASQAIIACRGGKSPQAHGVDVKTSGNPIFATEILIRDEGNVWELAEVLGSERLASGTLLGELLFSLPEVAAPVVPLEGQWPRAAFLWHDTSDTATLMAGRVVYTGIVLHPGPTSYEEARQSLAKFPETTKAPWFFPGEKNLPRPGFHSTPFGPGLSVTWEVPRVDDIVREYRWFDRRWLRPAIHDVQPPAPLITWWIVLFALSMLARYYPIDWIASIDRNTSLESAALEFVLDEALEKIPQLVLEAISNQPFLLPAPDLR